jgi:hypothetical protein
VQLIPIAPDEYARVVLPQTYALWGNGRTYEAYVSDFLKVASSRYGRRRKHTIGVWDGGTLGATCKLYSRELHWGERSMRAVGIGAVHTPDALRGRGYATVMLGSLLDAEAAAGTDVAYLFSDIRPEFYARLGFARLPSRIVTVRATSLAWTPIGAVPMDDADWPLVRRCFDALEARRAWGFKRTPIVWEWIRLMWAPRPQRGVQPVNLLVRGGRGIHAYVFGRRIAGADTFVVDELGFADGEQRDVVAALLRAAAGDLARVSGWLPPEPARDALPRGSVRARRTAIFMLVPLSALARSWWKTHGAALLASPADPIWSTDHI